MMNYDKAVAEMLSVDGALAAAVVDFSSGMMLAGGGSPAIDLEIAAAGNTEVMSSKMKTMKWNVNWVKFFLVSNGCENSRCLFFTLQSLFLWFASCEFDYEQYDFFS